MKEDIIELEGVIKEIYGILDDRKAMDIRVLSLEGLSAIADYFIIASGTSGRHIDALADYVELQLGKHKMPPKHKEGRKSGTWVLLDYGDIIVHLFNEETRTFYGLENVWIDAKEIDMNSK